MNNPKNYIDLRLYMEKFNFNKTESEKIFFTSDTHFNHANIIKYCKRPFNNTLEMDETIIENWNKKVPKDGIVFHLGDVGFGNTAYINSCLSRLNGTIILCVGNHDFHGIIKDCSRYFETITQQINMTVDGIHIILNHYPLLTFGGAWRGENASWQLFGHVHTSPYTDEGLDQQRMKYLFTTQYDVGVDNNNFTPVSFNEVKEIINTQQMSLGMCRNTL